ncbi:MAG: hypothetical protein ACPGJV_10225 [Bacteriovoracaceae bacterium]
MNLASLSIGTEIKKSIVEKNGGIHRIRAIFIAYKDASFPNFFAPGNFRYFLSAGEFSSEEIQRTSYVAAGFSYTFQKSISLD